MKIAVNFIDHKGFIHFKTAKSKRLLLDFIQKLKQGTDVYWNDKSKVTISQQYVKSNGGKRK